MAFATNFIKKIESDISNLFLVNSQEEGMDCWHYIIADKKKIPILKEKIKRGPEIIDLNNYGKIVRSGWGKQPSPEVKKQVESGDFSIPPKEFEYKIMWLNNKQDGRPFHAFVAVEWELVEKFEYMANNIGNMDLEEWGIVLETAWGNAPQDRIDYYSSLDANLDASLEDA